VAKFGKKLPAGGCLIYPNKLVNRFCETYATKMLKVSHTPFAIKH